MQQPLKFKDYPFNVPNEKKFVKKMEGFIADLKACSTAEEANRVINRINKYMEVID